MAPTVGDRKQCGYSTKSGGPCGITIELRQGPNRGLPPGWYEVANGHPHSCRTVCPACRRRVGGPDGHAPGCDRYARLLQARTHLHAR